MSSAKLKMSAEPSSSSLYERAEKAARMIRARANVEVSVAIVLGSGLGVAETLGEIRAMCPLKDLSAKELVVSETG